MPFVPPSAEPAPVFTGVSLDRAAELRHDADAVARRLGPGADPAPVVIAAGSDAVLLTEAGDALLRHPLGHAADAAPGVDVSDPILLGLEDGTPVLGVDFDALGEPERGRLLAGGQLASLRDAGMVLPQAEGGLAAYLVALLGWHRRHRFCANCGAPTTVREAGLSRRCPSCGAAHFPRTDPVVIMLVAHEGRLLLGRRPGWPATRYSVLAGFVSAGETPEEAVVREVREESGIEARDPRYVAAQPWPFPSSLMLGYEAGATGGSPAVRDGELEDVGWFDLETVRDAQQERGSLRLPPAISIARLLIDRWVAAQSWG